MINPRTQIVEADLTWTGRAFETNVRLRIDSKGRIERVGADLPPATKRLERSALLPGFVSAHSHAFQRGLRGLGEQFPAGAGSFWTWREAMYDLVRTLTPDVAHDLSRRAYEEMLDAGITCVGEFHYVRHAGEERDHALDDAVLSAARDAGIRLALIPSYYQRGGFGEPLSEAQRRFETPSPAAYWRRFDDLAERLRDESTQTLAASFHSVRAAPTEHVGAIGEGGVARGVPIHAHLEEQRREIDACRSSAGASPLRLALDALPDEARLVAVHATHSTPEELRALRARGGSVCLCPLTEANLGDGIADVPAMLEAGLPLSVGTDSNARLSMIEEMRWLECVQRLRLEKRGIVLDADGGAAPRLLEIATRGGAESLGLPSGRIEAGAPADLVAIDLAAPCLAGATPETLLESLVFGGGDEAIVSTCVNGVWRESRPTGASR